jgi:hypothetical protein
MGRLLAEDPSACWIVSSAVCLFQFHREEFISEALVAFMLQARPPEADISDLHHLLQYHPERYSLQAVVNKIILSVWENVVNTKHLTIPFPEKLANICRRGHFLDARDFGMVAQALSSRDWSNSRKCVLHSKHLLRNLTLWLICHFDGHIVVTVCGRIEYQKQAGQADREVELRVDNYCPETGLCEESEEENPPVFELLREVEGKFDDFLRGIYPQAKNFRPDPGVRRDLYQIHRPSALESKDKNRGRRLDDKLLQQKIRESTMSMMNWLLDRPVLPRERSSDLGFSVLASNDVVESPYKVRDILHQIPGLVNLNWGIEDRSSPFAANLWNCHHTCNDTEQEKRDDTAEVLEYFPCLESLRDFAEASCLCPFCRHQSGSPSLPPPGCLQRDSINEVMQLLAHGIADGFGVSDASAVRDASPIIQFMVTILLEICQKGRILWNYWFGLAATVLLGHPLDLKPGSHENGANSIAAVQYGDLVAIAPWLDLTGELRIKGSFHLEDRYGILGVIEHDTSNLEEQFRDIEQNFAVVRTQHTEDTRGYVKRSTKDSIPQKQKVEIEEDNSEPSIDMVLRSVGEHSYRLMMRVRSTHHSRIVSPDDALAKLGERIRQCKCKHQIDDASIVVFNLPSKLYSFDEVLGRWGHNDEAGDSGTVHITRSFGTPTQRNIALALAVDDVAVVGNGSCCNNCLQTQVRNAHLRPGEEDKFQWTIPYPKDRFIINVSRNLETGVWDQVHGPGGSITNTELIQDVGGEE